MEPVAPARYDWTVVLLSSWLIGGLFLDGWAHNHVASLETFFTPWHAVLYSGYAALAALYFVTALRNRGGGAAWQRVMPVGYQASLVGAIVFGIGGGLDLLWHTIFGIERSVDALLSPTHLLLATGIILMVTGPLRAAWRKPDGGAPALPTLVPAILSISYLLAVLRFFTQYASPIVHSYADKRTSDLLQGLGVASILLQTAILMGIVLTLTHRWRLPFGTFAIMLGITDGLEAVLAESAPVLAVALLGIVLGLLIDVLYLAARPTQTLIRLRLFAFAAPASAEAVYFAALAVIHGIAWSVHMWAGSIALAGAVGLLLSYVAVAPGWAGVEPRLGAARLPSGWD